MILSGTEFSQHQSLMTLVTPTHQSELSSPVIFCIFSAHSCKALHWAEHFTQHSLQPLTRWQQAQVISGVAKSGGFSMSLRGIFMLLYA